MITKVIHRTVAPMVATLLTALALTACMVADPQASSTLDMVAKDYSLTAPSEVAAGWVKVSFTNQGQEPHHAQLLRLNDGVSAQQFQATLRDNFGAALGLVTFAGGPGSADPGVVQTVTTFLEPGSYVMLCFIPDREGVSHLAHGMVAPLEVVSERGYAAAEPIADATARMVDFGFVLPDTIRAGKQTWKVTADGVQPHELLLVKLQDGKQAADVPAWFHEPAGPPPFQSVGGLQALAPGTAGYMHLDLAPGSYVAVCHVPDPGSGKEHMDLGMLTPFTVE